MGKHQMDLSRMEENAGWIAIRNSVESGVGRLTIFRPAAVSASKECAANSIQRRLIRIFFEDTCRMDFIVQCRGSVVHPHAADTFRLLKSNGDVLERSFAYPLGCEVHARAACLLLEALAKDSAQEHRAAATGQALAEIESRRGKALLMLHGATSPDSLWRGTYSDVPHEAGPA